MASIIVDRITTAGTTLECEVHPPRGLKRFFTGAPLTVEYGVDIDDVPPGILAIPVLSQICPVAWARGVDVSVETVDPTFARALTDVEGTLCAMYDFMQGSTLYVRRPGDESMPRGDSASVDRLVDPVAADVEYPEENTISITGTGEYVSSDATSTATDTHPIDHPPTAGSSSGNNHDEGNCGLLFTGGVDSTSSYVAHREKDPILISIRGWTIRPDPVDDEKWAQLTKRVTRFGEKNDLDTAFVEANMLSFLDNPMLLSHYGHRVDGGWYSSVGHGLGLLGLCAPLCYALGVDDLYVAATHWDGIDLEWGSRPDIDDRVRWTGTQCHHDGYERTRQERLELIAEYVRGEAPDLQLQTCNSRMDGNCGRCEKCYRTAVGLRLAGLEPSDHGYPFEDHEYEYLRRSFERGEWILGEDERYMWEDIREYVDEFEPSTQAEREFVEWLRTVDLTELVDDSGPPFSQRILRASARNAPTGLYTVLYPAWKLAKAGYRKVGTRTT